ncbi:MAG: phosphate ABC transporter permease subunit PstC [Gemmataceae bacterium]|nr:phosphate ABC transporter permease subunit PstC [Gemmataceae bacterium]
MPSPGPSSRSELIFQGLTRAAGVGVLAVVAGLVGVLLLESWPVLSRAGEYRLFTSTAWVPKPADNGTPTFGALAFVWGTTVTSAIAMLLAVPLGVAGAAFLSEIAPGWVQKAGAFLIELLAAIPSVVYGFWGLFFLAPAVQWGFDTLGPLWLAVGNALRRLAGAEPLAAVPNNGGLGLLSAGLILAVMILPYVTAITYDVCRAVPRSQREGSLALGATRWQTIRHVVLPYARPGILAASFLALGRALGETMAVTMLVGNQAVVELSPFALGDSIASRIANQLNEADTRDFRAALVALALVLFAVTATFNVAARLLLARLTRGPRTGREGPLPPAPSPTKGGGENDETGSGFPPPLPVGEGAGGRGLPIPSSAARVWNRVMTWVLGGCLLATVVPLFLILGYIVARGAAAVTPDLFLEDAHRPNLTNDQFEQYRKWAQTGRDEDYPLNELGKPALRGGLGHAMVGSLMLVAAATLLAVPAGLAAAVFLAEARRSRLAAAVRFAAELLGGVPSIVVGIFAYSCLVYPFWWDWAGGGRPPGFNGWAGAFALGVMMIPIVVRSAEEAMRLVPDSLRQASYALGAGRVQTTLRVVLPAALPAIVTGVFLAVGRIAGETAPLLLTAGQTGDWTWGLSGQTPFLPGYIYNYSRSPQEDWRDQAWGGTVVLLAVVMLLNVGIRLLAGKRVVAAARAD